MTTIVRSYTIASETKHSQLGKLVRVSIPSRGKRLFITQPELPMTRAKKRSLHKQVIH